MCCHYGVSINPFWNKAVRCGKGEALWVLSECTVKENGMDEMEWNENKLNEALGVTRKRNLLI